MLACVVVAVSLASVACGLLFVALVVVEATLRLFLDTFFSSWLTGNFGGERHGKRCR